MGVIIHPVRFQVGPGYLPIVLLAALLAPLLALLPGGLSGAAAAAPNNWQVGNTVNLSKGTLIRQGPGLNFCYHTIVPVDNWAVKVIDARPSTDGLHWYDTSRAAAGDPSGGTGWVNVEQVDQHPGAVDRDNPCSPVVPPPAATPTVAPPPPIPIPPFVSALFTWWRSQPLAVQIAVLVAAGILLVLTPRLQTLGSYRLVTFIRAILWGIILAGLADITRAQWEPTWHALPIGGLRDLDLALVLLFLPVGWWAIGYVAAAAGLALALGILVVVILAILFYFYYLVTLIGAVVPGR